MKPTRLLFATGTLACAVGAIMSGCTPSRSEQTRPSADSFNAAKTVKTSTTAGKIEAARQPASQKPVSPESVPLTRLAQVPAGVRNESGLTVPRGFRVNIFAEGLYNPRRISIAPGGTSQRYDVFVTESRANRIRVLREGNGDGRADARFIFAENLNQPYGLSFHPAGWLYVANTDAIVRLAYRAGATAASGRSQFISPLTRGGYNQHWTRNLIFSPDAKRLYVTVGSSCNTCEERDAQRAAISVMNPDGSARRLLAAGLRNPVGVAWRPGTSELWTVVNERDYLGDDQPPDYLTLVRDGAFYGWPYAYTDIRGRVIADPDFGPGNPRRVQQTTPATVPVQAHSAALGLAFYPNFPTATGASGLRQFPGTYNGDAFLAYHGSWNRSRKTGYKIVRVDFQGGRPVSVSDFVTGFLGSRSVWGRPVDVQVAPDGSILFSDDDGGKIWRVSYGP